MLYPVAVWNTKGVLSAEVPDLPGVVTEADSLEALKGAIREAASRWMQSRCAASQAVLAPSPIQAHAAKPEFSGAEWLVIDLAIDDATA